MKRFAKRLSLFLLSLILILYMFPETAMAEGTGRNTYISPAQPQNQTQSNSLIVDIFGSPTSTATSTTVGHFFDSYVNKQNAIRDSYLSTARSYERSFLNSGNTKNFNRMVKAEDAASAANLKGLGVDYAGKIYGGYCLYKDITEYNDKSKHRHSSLAFLDQTLRGFNITAGALDNGGVKLATPLAIGGGILKDVVGGDTFSDWANQQDNIVLDYTDWIIDGVNDSTYEAFLYYMDLFNNTDDANVYGRPPYGTGVYKPNIYLYPTEETMITVSFDLPALLTTTIPQYERPWQVIASVDGSLTDVASGADYEFLFYESLTDPALFSYDSGWVLRSDTREAQFRQILTKYGFNKKERADFIEFWMEKLTPGVDYVMYPQLTEAIDNAMPITVSPSPNNSFRLWFAFQAFNGQTPATPVIRPISREGYILVEWGGYILE